MRSQSVFFPAFFDSFLEHPTYNPAQSQVEEDEQGYFVQLDVPGISKSDLKISVENRHLLIEGERKGKVPQKLRRVFSLPNDVEEGSIAAQVKDGVLELALPKKEQAKPKSIPVKEGAESFFKLSGEKRK